MNGRPEMLARASWAMKKGKLFESIHPPCPLTDGAVHSPVDQPRHRRPEPISPPRGVLSPRRAIAERLKSLVAEYYYASELSFKQKINKLRVELQRRRAGFKPATSGTVIKRRIVVTATLLIFKSVTGEHRRVGAKRPSSTFSS